MSNPATQPSASKPNAPTFGKAPKAGKKPDVERIAANEDVTHPDAKDGFVTLTLSKRYGSVGALQPDGSNKTFQSGERATLPLRQAIDLGLVDEDGDLITEDSVAAKAEPAGGAKAERFEP